MAKQLSFKIGSRHFSLDIIKVDRKKIYGWSELMVTNGNGAICSAALLNDDGMTVAPAGTTKPGLLSTDGRWVNRDELKAVDTNGNEVSQVASSFDEVIELRNPVSIDDYLSMNIDSVYQLFGDEARDIANLIGSDIYRFDFSYRGGYSANDACLLANGESLFMVIGTSVTFPFISIGEQGVIDEEICDEEMDEGIDFNMF